MFRELNLSFLSVICALLSFSSCGVRFFEPDETPATQTNMTTTTGPTLWLLSSPSSGITSADSTPQVTATAVETGSIRIYLDSSCETQIGSATASAGASFTVSNISVTGNGLKNFYYRTFKDSGDSTACASTGLSYTYQAKPLIQFSRTFYSAKETGVEIGSTVRVTRDIGGVANSVTVNFESVTARDGAHFSAGAATADFSASDSDLYQDIPISTFAISNRTGTTDTDVYFALRLSTPDANGSLSTRTMAQFNIIDTDDIAEYFFPHTFFSVSDSSSTIDLTVQRMTIGAAASRQITFTDGTAIGGTDYTATTLNANFGAGDYETTVTVPIFNVSSNRSFYAKIAQSGRTRPQSIAKIRILDSSETNSCNSASSPFGGGGGASSADPYLICSITQLIEVKNSNTSHFKLMADLEDDSSILIPIGELSGSFNGNERTISNFRYTGIGMGDALKGLFSTVYSSTAGGTFLDGINLLYSDVETVGDNSGILFGLSGGTNASGRHPAHLSNLHVSGFLKTEGLSTGIIGGYYQADQTVSTVKLENLLSSGYANNTTANEMAGMVGRLDITQTLTSYTLQNLYNTAKVEGDVYYHAGVLGYLNISAGVGNSVTLSNFENRGAISAGRGGGGVLGYVNTAVSSTVLTSMVNHGTLTGADHSHGGVIGLLVAAENFSITNSTNTGSLNAAGRLGGIVGYAGLTSASSTYSFSNNTNSGGASSTGLGAGGVIGMLVHSVNSASVSVNSNTVTAGVSGTSNVGGIVGSWSVSGTGLTLTANSNQISIAAIGSSTYVGGIVGVFANTAASGSTFTMDSNSVSAINMSGAGYVGGLLGAYAPTGAFGDVTLSNSTISGTITSGTAYLAGGAVGQVYLSGGNYADFYLSYVDSSADITGGGFVGGLIGYAGAYVTSNSITVSHSSSTGNVTNTGNVNGNAGGLIGMTDIQNFGAFTMTSSYSTTGTVSATTNASSGVGGMIGYVNTASSGTFAIDKCYSTNTVSAPLYTRVGGMFGAMNLATSSTATVSKSFSSGTVSALASAGGFAGQAALAGGATLAISNSYTSSAITTTSAANFAATMIGVVPAGAANITMTNVYARGILTTNGTGNTGGMSASTLAGVSTLSNIYWLRDLTYNTAYAADAYVLSDAQLQVQGNFTGWDFGLDNTHIWSMGTYPLLWNMP